MLGHDSPKAAAISLRPAHVDETILAGYNYDANYSIFWNDLTMSYSSSTRSSTLSGTPNIKRQLQP